MSAPDRRVFFVPSQFPTLQAAIEAAEGAVTIVVEPGAYDESLTIVDRPEVVIQSARLSRRGVVLGGDGAPAVIHVERAGLALSGIEVRSDGRSRGIRAVDATLNLQECLVAGNCAAESGGEQERIVGAGIAAWRSRVRVQKSTLACNRVEAGSPDAGPAAGGGLYLEECRSEIAGSTVVGNSVRSPVAARGGGIAMVRGRLRMWKSRVTDNLLRAPACEGGGLYLFEPEPCDLGGNVVANNTALDGLGGGLFLAGERVNLPLGAGSVVHWNHPDDFWSLR